MALRRGYRVIVYSLVVLVGLALVGVLSLWLGCRASLPVLDGVSRVPGLQGKVTVERDELGVPTVRAASRLDAARATGFLHAQDRFFQMDLSRRMAAGELAALFGGSMVENDRAFRIHRLRSTARQVLTKVPVAQREILDAYCAGVNTGLNALGARPPEYLALRSRPEPWLAEDTVLVVYSMFLFLQDDKGRSDAAFETLRKVLPPAAFDFFVPMGTDWDAAIDGSQLPVPTVPPPEQFSFEKPRPAGASASEIGAIAEFSPVGSNSWAVGGALSSTGAALVANDMHLGLRLPNTWYRMRIACPESGAGSSALDITGVTLPGVPVVIVGSNGYIAWAFTNSGVDTTDLILLETSPDAPGMYRTPEGWRRFEEAEESIKVAGGEPVVLKIESTIWGPVVPGPKGLPKRALRWIAHLPEAMNFQLSELERIHDAETALHVAPACGVPTQNFVVGDRQGHIGWTLMGRLPRRVGYSGSDPVSWADGARKWDGWLTPEEYPRVFDPPQGRIWTANNRIAGSPAYLAAGLWVTDIGARARQIRDDLAARDTFSAQDMLNIQLDDRAVFLERWQKLLLDVLSKSPAAERAHAGEMRRLVQGWEGKAAIDSAGYRIVRGFREKTVELLLAPISELCRAVAPDFNYPTPQFEQPVWTLLQERPAYLLNPRFKSYDELLAAAVDALEADFREQGLTLPEATWGQRNVVRIRHPLSAGAPLIGHWLDVPPESLPGDSRMPRVQSPQHGASERLAVSPGHEDQAIFHMPGGQSGHFLSPYYQAGHRAWAEGKAAPFLPGPARHTLTLVP
jgi:penicillin amidase